MFLRRARMTLCVALCIPVSALLAIAFEAARGGSFNVLTMTGLTLGIGMLVDNAVVVIESVARQRDMGRSPRAAAVLGARDVGLAVGLATMTSVVVFLPLIFMGGQRISIMLQAMGVPLCASLVFSLLIALVFIPTAAARVIGDRPPAIGRGEVRARRAADPRARVVRRRPPTSPCTAASAPLTAWSGSPCASSDGPAASPPPAPSGISGTHLDPDRRLRRRRSPARRSEPHRTVSVLQSAEPGVLGLTAAPSPC